jgi:hypothetical protein
MRKEQFGRFKKKRKEKQARVHWPSFFRENTEAVLHLAA